MDDCDLGITLDLKLDQERDAEQAEGIRINEDPSPVRAEIRVRMWALGGGFERLNSRGLFSQPSWKHLLSYMSLLSYLC